METVTGISQEIQAMFEREAISRGAECVNAARYLVNRGMKTHEQVIEWVRLQGLDTYPNDQDMLALYMKGFTTGMVN